MSTDRNLANTSVRRRRRTLVADHCDRCKLGQQVDVTQPPDRGSDTICRCTCHRVCRGCGCTDFHACLGGCSWVEPDLCSACAVTAVRQPGLIVQSAPTHWRWDRPHNPHLCILCLIERLAVRLGFAHYEED